MAWLSAVPKGAKQSRYKIYGEQSHGPDPCCVWLVDAVMECGLCVTSGMGMSPVPWSDISAWADCTGWDGYWIRQTVRELSVAYVNQHGQSEDPTCPSPMDVEIEQQRKTVANQLKRFIANRS